MSCATCAVHLCASYGCKRVRVCVCAHVLTYSVRLCHQPMFTSAASISLRKACHLGPFLQICMLKSAGLDLFHLTTQAYFPQKVKPLVWMWCFVWFPYHVQRWCLIASNICGDLLYFGLPVCRLQLALRETTAVGTRSLASPVAMVVVARQSMATVLSNDQELLARHISLQHPKLSELSSTISRIKLMLVTCTSNTVAFPTKDWALCQDSKEWRGFRSRVTAWSQATVLSVCGSLDFAHGLAPGCCRNG